MPCAIATFLTALSPANCGGFRFPSFYALASAQVVLPFFQRLDLSNTDKFIDSNDRRLTTIVHKSFSFKKQTGGNAIFPGNQRNRIDGLHGQRNETGLFFGNITASPLFASDHYDSLHRTPLKLRSMPMSYWSSVRFK